MLLAGGSERRSRAIKERRAGGREAPTRHFLFSCTQGGYARQCTSVHVSARQRSCTPGISRTPASTPVLGVNPELTPTPGVNARIHAHAGVDTNSFGYVVIPLYFNLMFVSSPRDREIVASIHLVFLPRHTVKCCPFSPATM